MAKNCNYCGSTKTERIELNRKIGLMYVSDYMYTTDNVYWTKQGYQSNNDDIRLGKEANWLYDESNSQWTISRHSDNTYYAFRVDLVGFIGGLFTKTTYAVRPSFYLNSFVKLIDGSGTSDDSYIVSL